MVHEYPHVNASVDGDSLIVHRDLHLGIAVDLDFKGLVAPVIRNADCKRMRLIAREIRDLAARAKSKQLGPDEVVGGTFTITNMGPFGTTLTLPIINQPQVAILATDGIRKEPVVVEGPDGDDSIASTIRHMLTLAGTTGRSTARTPRRSKRRRAVPSQTHDREAELADFYGCAGLTVPYRGRGAPQHAFRCRLLPPRRSTRTPTPGPGRISRTCCGPAPVGAEPRDRRPWRQT